MKDIPVATCATAIDFPDGTTIVAIIHEALYFGPSMDHSLLNPNQIRISGIPVSDDPFDKTRPFGIAHPSVFIPFETVGATIFFQSRTPTDDELDQYRYQQVELTEDIEWDPVNVDLNTTEQKETASRRHEMQSEMIGETDLVLGNISAVYVEQEFSTRLIGSVRTSEARINEMKRQRMDEINGMLSATRHSIATPEYIARKWGIGLDTARVTLRVTTQRGIRHAIHPLHRRYRTDRLNLHTRRLAGQWYMDHLVSKRKSLSGNTGAWVYTNGKFTCIYPTVNRKQVVETLKEFVDDVGIPEKLRADRAPEIFGAHTEFQKEIRRIRTRMSYTEPEHSNQNTYAELEIRELKRRFRCKMIEKGVHKRMWDYGLKHTAEIMQRIARGPDQRTGYEIITGNTPDISEWLDFDFYDLVWYYDKKHPETTDDDREFAYWLGVAHRHGSDMCYWVLPESGIPITRTSVQHVTIEDMRNPELLVKMDRMKAALNKRLDDTNFQNEYDGNFFDDIEEVPSRIDVMAYGDGTKTPSDTDYGDMNESVRKEEDDIDDDAYDKYIGAEVTFETGEGPMRATVKRRATEIDGTPIGHMHMNPLLDTREYEIEFEDGTTDRYLANSIAENIYAQLDTEGHQHIIIKDIIGHRKDETAITKEKAVLKSKNGNKVPMRTTKGWWFLVECNDGSTEWVNLKDLKDGNPLELAEYAMSHGINEEPAFSWWITRTMKKRDRIVKKLKAKYWRTTHKFGIRMPKTVEEALRIDNENGNDYWEKAIKKEMSKAKVAFEENKFGYQADDIRTNQAPSMIGFQEIQCHIVFDVKMDFTRKARFVAGGNTTETPASITYSSVVTRDSICLAFLIAALNDLEVLSCDIGNAYLNAPCREKVWFQAGRECGEDYGKAMIITRALYGLKSAGASWRAMFSQSIIELGFKSSIVDPDAYIRKNYKDNGTAYYEMVLVYVDDVLCISHKPSAIMDSIGQAYVVKEGSVKPPEIYLGANIQKYQLPNGKEVWSMSSEQYVKESLNTVRALLQEDGRELRSGKRQGRNPLPAGYRPELDTTPELDADKGSRYLQLIGILRWAIELGRIDINYEVAIMSQYSALPREGHLEAVYHIFLYLSKHEQSRLVFDDTMPTINKNHFNTDADWKDFYGDVKEEDPRYMPEPLGKPVQISCFVDANHAGNVVTRRSHTGVLIFVQNAPILWYSKKQATVEASTFGSELVALRIAKDLLVALRIKLKMFGVPLTGPANVFCDNQGVVKNTSIPESTLTKKHNAINYHVIREAVAARILRISKEDTETNLADILTKILTCERRKQLLGSILYSH
jgi:hypothetical protein